MLEFKLTAKFVGTMVLVVLIVLVINIMGIFGIMYDKKDSNERYIENYVRSYNQYISSENDQIIISKEGLSDLKKVDGWIQILDSNGKEVYSVNKPLGSKSKYTPFEIINAYKYYEFSTIFAGTKTMLDEKYTYIMGFDNLKIRRYSLIYEEDSLLDFFKKTGLILILSSLIVTTLVGYILSRGFTQPIKNMTDKIEELSKGKYSHKTNKMGIYSKTWDQLNDLGHSLSIKEKNRKEIDELRDEWISNISHDMRTPLSSIKGYAEILSDKEYDLSKEEIEKYGNIIENKACYIEELVKDLNLSARLKAGKITLNLEKTSITSLVRELIIDILNNDKYSSRDIDVDMPDEDIYILGDSLLLKRTLNNILYNSLLHNPEETSINIKVIELNNKINVLIEDDGNGIKEDEKNKIFERYYRGTNTGEGHKGSGLGMAISKDIIDRHGGNIEVESEIGVGTRFKIELKK